MEEEAREPSEHDELAQRVLRTPLGRRLQEIRARIVASGLPLLTRDDIEREVAGRQGSRDEISR